MNSVIFGIGVTVTAVSGIFMALFEYFHISTVSAAQMGLFLTLSFSGIAAAAIKAKRTYYARTD
ncbi:hypothetical protein EP073_03280 [Geovibrio thiophilus]|uniref:Uncharacterized protein n=1 Tax=Geovibrio thiophilus TaxID=139438 RepID=A0A3R5XWN3_9BACT|nr:hypothetical protein [Geovibrio thiophilus]QAR32457.1 hypothetical protein EP073_03280 [Geovibrio thiophilus]